MTEETLRAQTEQLFNSFLGISRLDCCSALLAGRPASMTLPMIQNADLYSIRQRELATESLAISYLKLAHHFSLLFLEVKDDLQLFLQLCLPVLQHLHGLLRVTAQGLDRLKGLLFHVHLILQTLRMHAYAYVNVMSLQLFANLNLIEVKPGCTKSESLICFLVRPGWKVPCEPVCSATHLNLAQFY